MSDLRQAVLETPIGPIGVTVGPAGVRRVSWLRRGTSVVEHASESSRADDDVLVAAVAQLRDYFTGSLREFTVPVDLESLTPSTRRVLLVLQEVPYGTSVTYGELAELSGTGLPARAIGAVMGANPVPIVIACHRVLAGDGLGGYSGGLPGQGLETKRWLLEHEGILSPRLW